MASEAAPEIMILAISSTDVISDENLPSQPDYLETNAEVVKAELSFYATPHTADYGEAVYDTLKNIESTCANDYAKFCSLPTPTVMSLEFMRRRVLAHASSNERSVNHAMERKHIMSHGMHIPVDDTPENPIKSRNLKGRCDEEDQKHKDDFVSRHGEVPNDTGKRSSVDDSNNHHWGPPPPPAQEDTLFEGSLGYGLMGDMCIYQNFENLVPSCQSSVADLHMLRSQYWEEESQWNGRMGHRGRPHQMSFFWVLITMGFFFGIGISLRRRRLANKDTRAILKAIQANPALAAQVEAESGVSMSSLGLLKGQKLPFAGLALVVKCMLILISMHFVVMAIGMLSLTAVHLILGDQSYRSPAAFVILFLAAVIQIAAIIYGLRRMRRNASPSNGSLPLPTIATAVLFKAANLEDGQNKSQSVEHNGPMMSFSTTTTTSSIASNGIYMTMKNAISGTAASSAADGAYSVLGTDDSVHGSLQKPMVYIGTPVVAHQPNATNWI